MVRGEVRIPFYWLVVGIAVAVVSPIGAFVTSVRVAQNNTRHIIAEQQRSQAAAQAEARRVACSFFGASLDAFKETPPTTATGRNLRDNYLEFYRISGCVPPRDK